MIYEITRPISLFCFSITSRPSSCTDDKDNAPSKTRYEATNARLTADKALCTHSSAKLLCILRLICDSIDMAAHIRPNVFPGVKAGRIFLLHFVEHKDYLWCGQGPACSRWIPILHGYWYAAHYKRWHETQPCVKRSPIDQNFYHLCSMVKRHITSSYLPILMQFPMSCVRHRYFICISVLLRVFRT